jgi:two-component system, chemotaxis family, CheB/CheR fusion protein
MVRRLMELHGGGVEVESAGLGQGATFILRLPMVASPAASANASVAHPPPKQPVRVLVVDDDRAVADSTALLLELNGHPVCVAYSGEGAIEQASGFEPQIVLLDIGLRGMDGYQTAARLRQLPGGRALRLVAVTGYGDRLTQQRCREAGFDDHLVKPVAPAELIALLREAVAQCPAPPAM